MKFRSAFVATLAAIAAAMFAATSHPRPGFAQTAGGTEIEQDLGSVTADETRVFKCARPPEDLAEPPPRDPADPRFAQGKETAIDGTEGAAAKPLCPEGQLPVPLDFKAPKGNIFFSGTAVDAPYNYAGAWTSAGGRIRPFDGGGVVTRVEDPAVASGVVHSLFEIAVQGGVGNGDIVEIGWRKTPDEGAPRLFVFHWVGWTPACYNGCGWVQWNPSIVPGMTLRPGSESYMGWVLYRGNWWAWYDNQWVGYFPGNLWETEYAESVLVQWFGEVYETDPTPETDMGNGRNAADFAAARFWYPCTVDAAAWVCWIHPTPSLNNVSTPWYTILNAGGSAHRWGGPGGRAGAGLDP